MKRGMSQIDWIMSLAIFVLYVAWLFVFITPSIMFGSSQDSLMVLLKNNFNKDFSNRIIKFPIFIEYNLKGFRPVIMDYPLDLDIKFVDDTNFIIWNNKLIFLANMTSNIRSYWMIEAENYTQSYDFQGLGSADDWVSTHNLSINLEQSFVDVANYKDDVKISNIDYRINDVIFSPINSSYFDAGFAAVYSASSQSINHTSYVFSYNPQIYNFITLNTDSTYTFEMDLELDNYPSYYSNNVYYGDFDYPGKKKTLAYSFDRLTLYGGSNSLTMFFDTDVIFNFTYFNTSLDLTITIPITQDFEYEFVFHDTGYKINRSDYVTRYGVVEKVEGINLNKITSNYTNLKQKWNFPVTRDFNIQIYTNTSIYTHLLTPILEIGTYTPSNKNIYSETQDLFLLNDGNPEPIHVNYKIW